MKYPACDACKHQRLVLTRWSSEKMCRHPDAKDIETINLVTGQVLVIPKDDLRCEYMRFMPHPDSEQYFLQYHQCGPEGRWWEARQGA